MGGLLEQTSRLSRPMPGESLRFALRAVPENPLRAWESDGRFAQFRSMEGSWRMVWSVAPPGVFP